MNTAIDVTDLLLLKDDNLIINISRLQVQYGEILGIMGHSGSGKTSLLKILGLLEQPTQGSLSILGETITQPDSSLLALRRRLGLVFQKPLLRDTSVWDNVTLGLKLRKLPRKIIIERVAYWLEKFQITQLAKNHPRHLSSIDACRVNLARIMALEPEILLLDEPLASLDISSRGMLLEELAVLLREQNTTTVYLTNDYSELPILSQRAMLLYQGSIIQKGAVFDIINNPQSAAAASMVGIDNIIAGYLGGVAEDEVEFNPDGSSVRLYGTPRDAGLGQAYALIRSDDVELDVFPGAQWNAVEGTILRIHPQGSQVKIHLDCGFPLISSLPNRRFMTKKYRPGQEVTAVFDPAATFIVRKLPL